MQYKQQQQYQQEQDNSQEQQQIREDRQQATVGTYDPNRLFDAIIERLQLKSDRALCAILKVARPVIRRIRCGELPVGASLLIWIQEATGISMGELRTLLGDRRTKFRLHYAMARP